MNRKLRKGGMAAVFTLIVIAAVILVNLIFGKLPAKYRKWDLSSSQILTLGDTTKDILDHLNKEVTIQVIADPDQVDERITSFVTLYEDYSDLVKVTMEDPVLHPDVLTTLDAEVNTVLISYPETGKKTSVSFNDIIEIDMMAYYQYQQIQETAFDGEGQITSAINYVANDIQTTAYTLSGHQETALPATVTDSLTKSGFTMDELDLMTAEAVPADCSLLIINNPQKDISSDEYTVLLDYLKNGGHLMLLSGATEQELTNLNQLCGEYGMSLLNGFAADQAPQHYYQNNPFSVIPEYDLSSGLFTGIDSSESALLTYPAALSIQEDLRDGLEVTPILTTSDSGLFVDPVTQDQTEGTYVLAAVATEPTGTVSGGEASPSEAETSAEEGDSDSAAPDEPTTVFTVIAAPSLIDESVLTLFPNITNLSLFMNAAVNHMPGVTSLSIPAKSLETTYNMVTAGGLWSALFIIVIPLIFLIAGFIIWMKRRKR